MQGKNIYDGEFRNWLSRSGWMDDLARQYPSDCDQRRSKEPSAKNPNRNGLMLQGKVSSALPSI